MIDGGGQIGWEGGYVIAGPSRYIKAVNDYTVSMTAYLPVLVYFYLPACLLASACLLARLPVLTHLPACLCLPTYLLA